MKKKSYITCKIIICLSIILLTISIPCIFINDIGLKILGIFLYLVLGHYLYQYSMTLRYFKKFH